MPAPDPHAIEVTAYENGRVNFLVYPPMWGCRKAGPRRAIRLYRAYSRPGGRTCHTCGGKIGEHKRADARYCGASCRTKAQNLRRAFRETWGR